jgi:hypothetical protein
MVPLSDDPSLNRNSLSMSYLASSASRYANRGECSVCLKVTFVLVVLGTIGQTKKVSAKFAIEFEMCADANTNDTNAASQSVYD